MDKITSRFAINPRKFYLKTKRMICPFFFAIKVHHRRSRFKVSCVCKLCEWKGDIMCDLMGFVGRTIAMCLKGDWIKHRTFIIPFKLWFWYKCRNSRHRTLLQLLKYWCQHNVNGNDFFVLGSYIIRNGICKLPELDSRSSRRSQKNWIRCLSPAMRYKSCSHNEAIFSLGFNMPDLWI